MKLVYSDYFKKRLKKRLEKSPELKTKVSRQLKLVAQNPKYPSLKTHKLKGTRAKEYAIWISGDLRITFVIFKDCFLLTDIITHNEY